MLPSAGDLESPLAEAITQCYQGATVSATTRMQLFRLAWDLIGESFGARQQLYERYGVGDPAQMMAARYLDYDKTAAVERVHTLLETAQRP